MSTLEASVTLEEVFAVVEAKRVPLAPELAGYLTLEIADGSDAGSGDIDPKTVFISEEGTVALVQPRKDVVTGEAEASVRAILSKLLDASGSGTPALSAAAKRKAGNGLPALVEELEAALIPVNRAAGRRALARLAREVKRVMLGVGRNANVPPTVPPLVGRLSNAPGAAAAKEEKISRAPAPTFAEEATTAKRGNQLNDAAAQLRAPEILVPAKAEEPKPEPRPLAPPAPRAPLPAPRGGLAAPPGRGPTAPPPRLRKIGEAPDPFGSSPPGGTKKPIQASGAVPKAGDKGPTAIDHLFGGDEVDNLLDAFGVSGGGEKQVARDLKAIAGLEPTATPPPADAKTLAELTKDVGKDLPRKLDTRLDGDDVESLLAFAEASAPLAPPLLNPGSSRSVGEASPKANVPAVAPSPASPPARDLAPSSGLGIGLDARDALFSPAINIASGAGAKPLNLDSLGDDAPKSPRAPGVPAFGALTRDEPMAPMPPPIAPPKKVVVPAAADTRPNPATTTGRQVKAETSETRPAVKRSRTGGSTMSGRTPRAPKTGLAFLVFALLVLGGGAIAIWRFAPWVFTGHKRPIATATPSSSVPTAPAPRCKVALLLTDVPANAEILLRMGQAPVDVERMPVGTRLELVATAEGYAPRRAVIKAEVPWDRGPDNKPRIEVPIQLDPSKAKAGTVDPWPAAEAGSQVGGSGPPGTVHVVSNVRGAEVWLLAGLGPEARIDQLRCDSDIDVLLAGPPALRKRLHINEKDIDAVPVDTTGNKVVSVSAK